MRFPTPPRKSYPSDLSDEQWSLLEPLVPSEEAKTGRPREVDYREVINAILYLNRSGCQWDMLPHDLPPKSTVYDYFAKWRDDGTWQRMMDDLRTQVESVASLLGIDRDVMSILPYFPGSIFTKEGDHAWTGRIRSGSNGRDHAC